MSDKPPMWNPHKPASYSVRYKSNWCLYEMWCKLFVKTPWLSLVKSACDESCIGSKWSRHPRGGRTLSAVVLFPPAALRQRPQVGFPSQDVTTATVPCKTKPYRSGFYLVLSNEKSLPHSTASAAGTCWCPSVKGIVYVVGDPELITIPPSPIHYCSSY